MKYEYAADCIVERVKDKQRSRIWIDTVFPISKGDRISLSGDEYVVKKVIEIQLNEEV